MGFSGEADVATLVRRVYLDLLGPPPSPEQVDAIRADSRAGAWWFERLIDSLLASPQFGERWGRHWRDVAGDVSTAGFNTDGRMGPSREDQERPGGGFVPRLTDPRQA